MNVYENLKKLAYLNATLGHATKAVMKGENVEVGRGYATIFPDNTAEINVSESSQGTNLIFAMLGLGMVENGTTTKARLVYWINGRAVRYTKGMKVDLTKGCAVDAPTLDEVKTDVAARNALLKLIRSKTDVAVMFLRMFDAKIPQGAHKALTPAFFMEAVRKDDVQKIATIPFLMNRSYGRHRQADRAFENFPEVLNAYITQNRAELYQAGGVTS